MAPTSYEERARARSEVKDLLLAWQAAAAQEEPAAACEEERVALTRANTNRLVLRQHDPAAACNVGQPHFVFGVLRKVYVVVLGSFTAFDERSGDALAEAAAHEPGDRIGVHVEMITWAEATRSPTRP